MSSEIDIHNKAELRKLLGAMNKDEQDEMISVLGTLVSFADLPIHVRVHSPATPDKFAEIRGRQLKDHEIIRYMEKLGEIDKELLTAKDPNEVPLTPDQLRKLHELFDEYITLSTRIPREFLTALGNNRTRYQLFKGIMIGSQPSEEQREQSSKFREKQPGVPADGDLRTSGNEAAGSG